MIRKLKKQVLNAIWDCSKESISYHFQSSSFQRYSYYLWLVKGKGIPYQEIINKTKRKLIKNKIKGYINGSY